MNTKRVLQVLLALGCLALAMAIVQATTHRAWLVSSDGWWEGAIACWMLVVAIRMTYPAQPN